MIKKPKIIVVGGGIAGLMATIKVAEAGVPVQLLSSVPVLRSHSVSLRDGLSAALNTKGEGDSPEKHFDDTIYGGDFLANQELPRQMCLKAPEILNLFDRMGVVFNRTPEGLIDLYRLEGTRYRRSALAGAVTGQQLVSILNQQVQRYEAEGLVEKFEGWEFLSVVQDGGGDSRGVTAINVSRMDIRAFACDAVILCTGSPGLVFGQSTHPLICSGSAASSLYQQGAYYANGEFIQFHPTALPGKDKFRAVPEVFLSAGGRICGSDDGTPRYFLEEWFPQEGNLVPKDVASRAIHKAIFDQGWGFDKEPVVSLDLSSLHKESLPQGMNALLEYYGKLVGADPKQVPLKVASAVHFSMGGLWIDDDHMTNLPGVLAAGDCDYQYHGANCLGGNALLSAVFGGMKAGESALRYAAGLETGCETINAQTYSEEVKRQWAVNQEILDQEGKENPHELHQELGEVMTESMAVVRYNERLKKADEKIQELKERFKKTVLSDNVNWMNQELLFSRELSNMFELAQVMVRGALARNESRGAHYKPEFSERDDENFLKTTKASWTPDGPKIEYEDVNVKYIKPRPRKYEQDKHLVEKKVINISTSPIKDFQEKAVHSVPR